MSWTMTLEDILVWTARRPQARTFPNLCLLLSFFFLSLQPDFVFSKENDFSWKAGQWGQCIGQNCGTGGVQTRTIWCVHTEGWTVHHFHCQYKKKPEIQQDCFKVCDWHQDLFKWEVSDWDRCVLVSPVSEELRLKTTECITAQNGIQRRKVHCVHSLNHTMVSERICEFFAQTPSAEQACLIPCPQDCVVSDFSSWSGCSKTCGVGLQHRTRHVLTTPVYGGGACPNLTETRSCMNPLGCPFGEREYKYNLKAGAWSECQHLHLKDSLLRIRTTVDHNNSSAENKTTQKQVSQHQSHQHQHQSLENRYSVSWQLEVGYRTRQVRCIRSDGRNSLLSLCIKDNSLLAFQACVMPKDCETSNWSLWSACSKTCRSMDLSPGYRLRSRIMTHIPAGEGKQCPAFKEKEACNIIGDLLPSCNRFVWRTTDWGPCDLLPVLSQHDQRLGNISNLCGWGIQRRRIYCVQLTDDPAPQYKKEVYRPVDPSLCVGKEPPSTVSHCSIPCKSLCLLSQWSSWGSCVHDNCKQPQGRKGFRRRRREVLWESDSATGNCLHLAEFIPCENPACYQWQIRQEGECSLNQTLCGSGTVAANVTCVSANGEDVHNVHCLHSPTPTKTACDVACPGDCVVGSWSLWSPCSHSCASKMAVGQQSRVRTVLAVPGKEGKDCPGTPALEEWRVCNDQPCAVFYWKGSTWGPCTKHALVELIGTNLQNDTPSCGVGVQIRKVSCIKMNSGPVHGERCPESASPKKTQPCLLPCKEDCIVTPFSEWSACPSSCIKENTTVAIQSRNRIIIQGSANGGQECPDTLYEERECESLPICPVYRWKAQKWQGCKLVSDILHHSSSGSEAACGHGLETRGVSCTQESGESASMTECLQWAGPLPHQTRLCLVPCKDDCTLTTWSKFSECSGCGSFRSRKRSLAGRSKKREHCLNKELYPLEDKESCPCEEYLSHPFGNWSSCILPYLSLSGRQGWKSQREGKECGLGLRFRAVACINQKGHLVNPTLCTETGYMLESCHIPCPLDCKLSDWSPWSACSASCGGGLKIRSKWLREKAFNGGRPCPRLDLKNQAQVYEAVACHGECNQYEWRTQPWSTCTVNTMEEPPGCGDGVQIRKVRSVSKVGKGLEEL